METKSTKTEKSTLQNDESERTSQLSSNAKLIMQQNSQPKKAAPNMKPKLSRYSQPKVKSKQKPKPSK
jgi:hypothetical protein